MDGTLADTSAGILNSHRYAHKMMGRSHPDTKVLESVIGGPLLNTYITRFGFSEAQARTAVAHYREYYAKNGLLEAELYPEMKNVLRILKEDGYLLAVATLKAERFVEKMLDHMGVLPYFDAVFGMDDSDTRTKAQLINMCMERLNADAQSTVMLGDSIHDLNGAVQAGVSFVGVTYGFGFKSAEERAVGCEFCDTPRGLIDCVKNL